MTETMPTTIGPTGDRPSWLDSLMFFLIFSGPPTFRQRDSDASLSGEIDLAIVFQLIVWGLAALWVLHHFHRTRSGGGFWSQLVPAQRVAMLLIFLLWMSTLVSVAPPLTAVKVSQMAIEGVFCWTFVRLYGVERSLSGIFWGSTLLCVLIAIIALLSPNSVFDISETGVLRLRGGQIAGANSVSAFGMILLLCHQRKLAFSIMAISLAFFSLLQFWSLTRTSWLALAVVILLAAWRQPRTAGLKWIYALVALGFIALLAGGYSQISQYRDPESIYDLSSRVGLWQHMTDAVLNDSPWLGLGYTAATRQLGMEFNPDLGTGHSIFFDVFIGGGFLSLAAFLALLYLLMRYAIKALWNSRDAVAFSICGLFFYILIMGSVGESIDTSPFGFTFWLVVCMLPSLNISLKPAAHVPAQIVGPSETKSALTAPTEIL